MRVHMLICGWLTSPMAAFMEDAPGEIKAPILSFLIEHPKGLVLFDTGMARAIQTDPEGELGAATFAVYKPDIRQDEDVAGRLQSIGVDPGQVAMMINSHLHFDHCGGNALIPNATQIVQRREWEAMEDPQTAKQNGLRRRLADCGHTRRLVDGEHDVFGDGSLTLLPTFGHSPGHQSLRVRNERGEAIFTADCCYFRRVLETLTLPPFGHDRDAQRDVLLKLRDMEAKGARLIFGHDPDQANPAAKTGAALLTV
jgi:glyoxylase-like metal-dependent hydrolase (beta-lactamase superfamily II)